MTPALPKATKGTSYSTSLHALGGVGALHWSIVKGRLPSGLMLNAKSGKISGSPTASGTFSFEAEVKDSSRPAAVATKQFMIVVAAKR
ncbi:MAG: Ig domain-containing protein [Acidimicrobiales bacterium]